MNDTLMTGTYYANSFTNSLFYNVSNGTATPIMLNMICQVNLQLSVGYGSILVNQVANTTNFTVRNTTVNVQNAGATSYYKVTTGYSSYMAGCFCMVWSSSLYVVNSTFY